MFEVDAERVINCAHALERCRIPVVVLLVHILIYGVRLNWISRAKMLFHAPRLELVNRIQQVKLPRLSDRQS